MKCIRFKNSSPRLFRRSLEIKKAQTSSRVLCARSVGLPLSCVCACECVYVCACCALNLCGKCFILSPRNLSLSLSSLSSFCLRREMQFTTSSRSLAFLPSPAAKKASSRVTTKALLSSKRSRRKRQSLNHHRAREVKMSTTRRRRK